MWEISKKIKRERGNLQQYAVVFGVSFHFFGKSNESGSGITALAAKAVPKLELVITQKKMISRVQDMICACIYYLSSSVKAGNARILVLILISNII